MDSDRELKPKNKRFKNISTEDKQLIFEQRKSVNTNRATRTWITCFNEYLVEKQLKPECELSIDELPSILSDFYINLRKKNIKKIVHKIGDFGKVVPQHDYEAEDYKNTSLKCIYIYIRNTNK